MCDSRSRGIDLPYTVRHLARYSSDIDHASSRRCMDLDVLSSGAVFESQTENRDMNGVHIL
jgi:hypothetical protein